MDYSVIINTLKQKGIIFETGLSKEEINTIEEVYSIIFPPDLKAFLQFALPISNSFINWRDLSKANMKFVQDKLNWPLEGIIFDIKENNFWFDGWGVKPNDLNEAIEICKFEFKKVPKLIPICSHRYISSEPFEDDNPILSVYQTDIIYYGENLLSYLDVEFRYKEYKDIDFSLIKKIRFWSELID